MIVLAFPLFIAGVGVSILFLRTMKTTQGFTAPESSAKKNIHLITYHKSEVMK